MALPDLYSIELSRRRATGNEASDDPDTEHHSSAENVPRERMTIGLHAHSAEPRIAAAMVRFQVERQLLVRITRGGADA